VYRLVELVSEERQATRENVERKQARTANELEDDEEDNAMDEDTDEEDEQTLYNPKKLPLGMFIQFRYRIYELPRCNAKA